MPKRLIEPTQAESPPQRWKRTRPAPLSSGGAICKPFWLSAAFLALVLTGSTNDAWSVEPSRLQGDYEAPVLSPEHSAYLGLSNTFGRWENGFIPIAYNHAGAREDVSQEEMLTTLLSSFAILEGVADLYFDFQGVVTNDLSDKSDGLVVVGWEDRDPNFAARAGPVFSPDRSDFERLGYWPFVDGRVRINRLGNSTISLYQMLHELIHLLGFGHSENPYSIMNYSALDYAYPLPDDVAALQAMYGPPDEFRLLTNDIEDTEVKPPLGVWIDPDKTGFYLHPQDAEEVNFDEKLTRIDDSLNPDDYVRFRVGFQGVSSGAVFHDIYRDPHGNIIRPLYGGFTVDFTNGSLTYYVERVGDLLTVPGTWAINILIDGQLAVQQTIEVDGEQPSFNHTPEAQLSIQRLEERTFRASVTASDPEGDNLTFDWFIPNLGSRVDAASTRTVVTDGTVPVQLFVSITDDGERQHGTGLDDGSGPGEGVGFILSRWLVEPGAAGTPSFFVEEQILHVPAFNFEGTTVSMNFKLTALEGIRLKLLESDIVPDYQGEYLASLSPEGHLLLDKLMINEGGAWTAIENIRFSIEVNEQPIKITLLQ